MLKILLESFLLEIAQNNLNADKEINYLYETLNNSFTTDLQKEILKSNIGIQELKLMCYEIVTSEEFKEELEDLNITLDNETNNKIRIYNEVVNTLMSNDSNASYDEILADNSNNYTKAISELTNCLESCLEEYSNDVELYNHYNELLTKLNTI